MQIQFRKPYRKSISSQVRLLQGNISIQQQKPPNQTLCRRQYTTQAGQSLLHTTIYIMLNEHNHQPKVTMTTTNQYNIQIALKWGTTLVIINKFITNKLHLSIDR
jgi:hypothetical protein